MAPPSISRFNIGLWRGMVGTATKIPDEYLFEYTCLNCISKKTGVSSPPSAGSEVNLKVVSDPVQIVVHPGVDGGVGAALVRSERCDPCQVPVAPGRRWKIEIVWHHWREWRHWRTITVVVTGPRRILMLLLRFVFFRIGEIPSIIQTKYIFHKEPRYVQFAPAKTVELFQNPLLWYTNSGPCSQSWPFAPHGHTLVAHGTLFFRPTK